MSDQLKTRIHAAAEHSGVSAHSIILKAIEEKADQLEQQAEFHNEANQRFKQLVENGEKIAWDDMQTYLAQLISGEETASAKVTTMAAN